MVKTNKETNFFLIADGDSEKFIAIKAFKENEFVDYINLLLSDFKEGKIKTVDDYISRVCNDLVIKKRGGQVSPSMELFNDICENYKNLNIETMMLMFNNKERHEIFSAKKTSKLDNPDISKNYEYFNKLIATLNSNIIGQEKPLNEICDLLKLKETGFSDFISAMFVGSTGVGKTETARMLAAHYFGSKDKLIKINCGEYANSHEQNKLLGSPPGYIGSDGNSFLSELAEESDQWVFLFDEFEKSSDRLKELLLGVLDDGYIVDNRGNNLDFSKSIFLFTSNVGVKNFMEYNKKEGMGFHKLSKQDNKDFIKKEIEDSFAPELLNRFDKIIHFNTLSKEDAIKIAKLHLIKEVPTNVVVDDELVEYVVENSYSEEYGARNIRRFIKNEVCIKLADHFLKERTQDKLFPIYKDKKLLNFAVSGG